MQSFDGRASVLLTLLLAGVLAAVMTETARPPADQPKASQAKPETPPAESTAVSKTVVLPAPPTLDAPKPVVAAAEPAITPLTPTSPAPQITSPKPQPRKIEPLRAAAPEKIQPPIPTTIKAAPAVTPVKAVQRPTPTPAPAAKPQPVKHPSARAAATGRVLLRVLEHGEGPAIEIAWPETAVKRAALADHMRRCYGMRLALMNSAGALYADKTPRGSAWRPNLDLYSGFVRRTTGRLPGLERKQVAEIRRRHGPVGAPVHVFPRRVDALLLGGLQSLIGARYQTASSIRAHYSLSRGALTVGAISIDGRAAPGRINLAAAQHCRGGVT